MAGETNLFKIDSIVVDGIALAFEDGSGVITGAARFTNEAVPSASGDDFTRRRRVTPTLAANIQFGPGEDPTRYANMRNVQITGRDLESGRRALMPNCTFAELGDIGGGGPVSVKFLVLAPIQWL